MYIINNSNTTVQADLMVNGEIGPYLIPPGRNLFPNNSTIVSYVPSLELEGESDKTSILLPNILEVLRNTPDTLVEGDYVGSYDGYSFQVCAPDSTTYTVVTLTSVKLQLIKSSFQEDRFKLWAETYVVSLLNDTSAEDIFSYMQLAEAWAEGTEPGGSGTKSAKEWALTAASLGVSDKAGNALVVAVEDGKLYVPAGTAQLTTENW